MKYYFRAFRNYAKCDGRATRKEYWMFLLFHYLFTVGFVSVVSVCLGFLIPVTGWNPILILWLINLFFGYKENRKNKSRYFYLGAMVFVGLLIGFNLFMWIRNLF